ncbi:MAG: Protease Do [Candidatus Tokpelaia sp. JSC085]|nr:MAG: Protease Do [Candidatus Tokpelaia sp. JSC085]
MRKVFYTSVIFSVIFLSCSQFGFTERTTRQIPETPLHGHFSFAPLVKKTIPAVVNIYAARQVRTHSPFDGDPLFEQFFGHSFSSPSRVQSSLGSGVIVDTSGLIVTNNHVIRGADKIRIALSDGREFESVVVLKDEAMDIAVLRMNAKNVAFPVIALADSDMVEVGDLVLAIGNPFGVGQTVTSGIVSAQARTSIGISDFDFFIQTDAAINPGNSGGALINMEGDLIGLNTAIYSRTGGSIGIGFAIPSNLIHPVVDAVRHGKTNIDQPYFGATFQTMTSEIAKSLGIQQSYGVIVTNIAMNSPAEKAELKIGDVITKAQGVRIDNLSAFDYRLMTTGIGKTLKLEIFRNGTLFYKSVTLQSPPSNHTTHTTEPHRIEISSPLFGVEVVNLTPLNAHRFHQPPTIQGVVINDVDKRSKAAMLFTRGDIIRSVNGQSIRTISDLKRILTANKTPSIWQFQYERKGVLIHQFLR